MASRPVPSPALWSAPAGQTPPLIPPGATIGPSFGGTVGGVTSVGAIAPIASSGGTTPVISLNNSTVVAGTYGSGTLVGQFTTDAHGLLQFAGNVAISSTTLSMPAEFTVGGSPAAPGGTFTVTKANETANTVWAGPTTGAAAQPTFRALVTADLPAGTGTVTSFSATGINGIIPTVTNPTTTPALALNLVPSFANYFG